MPDYLKCSKCGSEKFKPTPENCRMIGAMTALEFSAFREGMRTYTCADCGHVMKVGKIKPEWQKVILAPDEKVVE